MCKMEHAVQGLFDNGISVNILIMGARHFLCTGGCRQDVSCSFVVPDSFIKRINPKWLFWGWCAYKIPIRLNK
jgi:hypothetical protein